MAYHLAADTAADQVLDEHPFALLVGMMLDQQYPMEHAFRGPAKILERFGSLDPQAIAETDPERFADLCSVPPAIHRYPRAMAARVQSLARIVVEEYAGDPRGIWTGLSSGADLLKRIQSLPGFGRQKAQIFVALLAKQAGVRPDGWEQVAGDYGLPGFRSVADVVDAGSLVKVREFKQERKQAAKRAAKEAAGEATAVAS